MKCGDLRTNLGKVMDRVERFSRAFVADVAFATEYYDSISTATGNRFREKLDDWLNVIMQAPEGFAKIYETVRAARVRGYPYVVLFETHSEHVVFLGLVHGAGSREHWFERLR